MSVGVAGISPPSRAGPGPVGNLRREPRRVPVAQKDLAVETVRAPWDCCEGDASFRAGPHQPKQFYRGGQAIAEWRGLEVADEFRPEAGSLRPRAATARVPTVFRVYLMGTICAR